MKSLLLLLIVILSVGLAACGGGGEETAVEEIDPAGLAPSVDVSTVYALSDHPDVYLLDVREPDEYDAAHIPGITLIPMGEVADRLSEIPTDRQVIVTCRTGNRSGQVVDFLRQQGFTNVHNMEGGIVAWEEAGYPVE